MEYVKKLSILFDAENKDILLFVARIVYYALDNMFSTNSIEFTETPIKWKMLSGRMSPVPEFRKMVHPKNVLTESVIVFFNSGKGEYASIFALLLMQLANYLTEEQVENGLFKVLIDESLGDCSK